jgi:hypothetical protein
MAIVIARSGSDEAISCVLFGSGRTTIKTFGLVISLVGRRYGEVP